MFLGPRRRVQGWQECDKGLGLGFKVWGLGLGLRVYGRFLLRLSEHEALKGHLVPPCPQTLNPKT